jgi:hypothetical protein
MKIIAFAEDVFKVAVGAGNVKGIVSGRPLPCILFSSVKTRKRMRYIERTWAVLRRASRKRRSMTIRRANAIRRGPTQASIILLALSDDPSSGRTIAGGRLGAACPVPTER